MKQIELYTDGSALGNPGRGGWAYILKYNEHIKKDSGGVPHATNNQMELLAVIKGLSVLKERCYIKLYSDSKYVLDGLNTWIKNWKHNGWRTSSRKPVANGELWKELDALSEKHYIEFNWVKGHNGDPMNEEVDSMAQNAARGMKKEN
ncbi:MAG: ribonuclease HI [Sphaerochaeta sp.]|jgi:ribonuclease HI